MNSKHLGHQAKKRFGQNFLHNDAVISDIIDAINPEPGENLIEIGPGLGALTEPVVERAGKLSVVELDRDLAHRLRHHPFIATSLTIFETDALKFDFSQLVSDEANALRIFGNLPYNISTPLIFHLLTFKDQVKDMHFMLQKEVVLRLAAGAGTNNYGRLSIMAQYFCRIDNLFEVPPEAFDPRPKVDSAIVRMAPYIELPHTAHDFKHFEQLVKSGFAQRRKTLRNNLKGIADDEQLQSLGIDPSIRPEPLTVGEFVAISNLLTHTPS
jgi:16S rRNA (adenine1518-N6/adenine1519-N6)-dimethyltransferase